MRQNPRWHDVEASQYPNKFRTVPGGDGGPRNRDVMASSSINDVTKELDEQVICVLPAWRRFLG